MTRTDFVNAGFDCNRLKFYRVLDNPIMPELMLSVEFADETVICFADINFKIRYEANHRLHSYYEELSLCNVPVILINVIQYHDAYFTLRSRYEVVSAFDYFKAIRDMKYDAPWEHFHNIKELWEWISKHIAESLCK